MGGWLASIIQGPGVAPLFVAHPEPGSKPYLSLTCVREIMHPDSGCIHNYRLTSIRLSSWLTHQMGFG